MSICVLRQQKPLWNASIAIVQISLKVVLGFDFQKLHFLSLSCKKHTGYGFVQRSYENDFILRRGNFIHLLQHQAPQINVSKLFIPQKGTHSYQAISFLSRCTVVALPKNTWQQAQKRSHVNCCNKITTIDLIPCSFSNQQTTPLPSAHPGRIDIVSRQDRWTKPSRLPVARASKIESIRICTQARTSKKKTLRSQGPTKVGGLSYDIRSHWFAMSAKQEKLSKSDDTMRRWNYFFGGSRLWLLKMRLCSVDPYRYRMNWSVCLFLCALLLRQSKNRTERSVDAILMNQRHCCSGNRLAKTGLQYARRCNAVSPSPVTNTVSFLLLGRNIPWFNDGERTRPGNQCHFARKLTSDCFNRTTFLELIIHNGPV